MVRSSRSKKSASHKKREAPTPEQAAANEEATQAPTPETPEHTPTKQPETPGYSESEPESDVEGGSKGKGNDPGPKPRPNFSVDPKNIKAMQKMVAGMSGAAKEHLQRSIDDLKATLKKEQEEFEPLLDKWYRAKYFDTFKKYVEAQATFRFKDDSIKEKLLSKNYERFRTEQAALFSAKYQSLEREEKNAKDKEAGNRKRKAEEKAASKVHPKKQKLEAPAGSGSSSSSSTSTSSTSSTSSS